MAHFTYFLKDPKAEANTPILLRVMYKGTRVRVYTGRSVHPDYWSQKKQEVKRVKAISNADRINERLTFIKNQAEAAFLDYQRDNDNKLPPPSAIREKIQIYINIRKEESRDLFSFFQSFIDHKISEAGDTPIRQTTIPSYQSCLDSLKKFQAKKYRRVDFDSIDLKFYTEYLKFLGEDLGLKRNTQGKYIRRLKTILNKATAAGINKNLMFKDSSFKAFSEEVEDIYLSEEEIMRLKVLDVGMGLEIFRDLLIVLCYTGLRHSDLNQVRPENIQGDNLYIKMKKTKARIAIPLLPPAIEILEKYDYNLPSYTLQPFNRKLKQLGQLFNEKDEKRTKDYSLLSTHTGRRSFCTNMIRRGISVKTIMRVSGHRTERDFFRYIKTSSDEDAKALKEAYNNNGN